MVLAWMGVCVFVVAGMPFRKWAYVEGRKWEPVGLSELVIPDFYLHFLS